MKKVLKINFSDFWGDLNKQDNLFINLLKPYYEVVISEDPDVLFYSCYSFEHLKYNCFKIFYTAENVRPNFMECDFAISFDFDSYKNRNLRLPLFRWSPSLECLYLEQDVLSIIESKRKFCCMVVSNGGCKMRNKFFEQLNEYKKVDSGGKFLNNIGYQVPDKREFIKDYKFVLSFENSSYPGYTTEKIYQPMQVNCLPVFWGNPEIQKDFNTKSFINVHDYPSFRAVIEEIIRIDSDDELYRQYLEEPFFVNNKMPPELELKFIADKIFNAIESFQHKVSVSKNYINTSYGVVNKYKKKIISRLYKKQHWYC